MCFAQEVFKHGSYAETTQHMLRLWLVFQAHLLRVHIALVFNYRAPLGVTKNIVFNIVKEECWKYNHVSKIEYKMKELEAL